MKKKKSLRISGGGNGIENIQFDELEVLKYFNGFDIGYIGFDQYLPLISRRLNDYHYTKFFEDKGLIELFSKTIKMPKTICKCINGEYYDGQMQQISYTAGKQLCIEYQADLIVKPSREGYGGFGIKKVQVNDKEKLDDAFFKSYGKDFIIQECIRQHQTMAVFNETSVNTFRVTSLYLNGKVSICSCMLRFGNKGGFTDNHCSGGNIIGIFEDGSMCEHAYDMKYSKFYEVRNKKFKNIKLEFIPKMLELVKKAHKNDFPVCKFIGWDICIDEYMNPILIEINASQHDIFIEQLTTGPVFNGREQEVRDYIKNKKFEYGRSILKY